MAFELRSGDGNRVVTESTRVAKPKNQMNRKKALPPASDDFETKVNKFLGDPTNKAFVLSEKINMSDTNDALRHVGGGRYTQEAIEKRLGSGPMAKLAGIVGSNVMGIGHEATSFVKDDRPFMSKLRESAEDITNNFVGSMVGANPFASAESKDKTLISLVKNNALPDGFVKDKRDKSQSQNMYFKDTKGKVKQSKY